MDSLLFLLAVAVTIALGTAFIALRNRQPRGDHHGIREFQRNMQALSPEARRSVVERTNVRIRHSPSSDQPAEGPGE